MNNSERLKKLEEYYEKGLVSKSEKYNLVLYNYTEKCTFDNIWDDITINARGTIYNKLNGDIVAYAFPKFFNLNQHEFTRFENLPKLPFETFEKMDGSLGVSYMYEGEYFISTRGSFFSDQAHKGTEMFRKLKLDATITDVLQKKTYNVLTGVQNLLFEIIYPENRIIVNYGKEEKLVLIGGYWDTGQEVSSRYLDLIASQIECERPKRFLEHFNELIEQTKTMSSNEEGFVIRYSNGLRVKLKCEDYLRVARALTNNNYLAVWEALKDDTFSDVFKDFPDEFREDLTDKKQEMLKQHFLYTLQAMRLIQKYNSFIHVDRNDKDCIKKYALEIQQEPKAFQGLLFQMMRLGYNEEMYELLLEWCWDLCRPTGNVVQDIVMYDVESHTNPYYVEVDEED